MLGYFYGGKSDIVLKWYRARRLDLIDDMLTLTYVVHYSRDITICLEKPRIYSFKGDLCTVVTMSLQ